MTSIKKKPSFLRLVAWNANSIVSKIQELREFLIRFRVDVALIGETHLKTNHRANIANYKCYRNDRLTGRGGGTAVYIKSNIDHHVLPTPPDLTLEITPVCINTIHGELVVVACYNSPLNAIIRDDISTLFSLSRSVVLAGDFNAKHTEWNSLSINGNGRRLKSFSDEFDFIINAPISPTRVSPLQDKRSDVLDIVAYKNSRISPDIEVAHELSSDHLPTLFSWGSEHEGDYHSVIKKRTSWKQFRERLDDFTFPDVDASTEEKVALLEEQVQGALDLSTSTRLVPESFEDVPLEILELIRARRRAIKLYMRTLSPLHKTAMNTLSFQVKNALDRLRNEKWQEKLEGLNPEDGSLWTLARTFRRRRGGIGVLRSADVVAVTDLQKAELFADSLYNIANDSLVNEAEHISILHDLQQVYFRPGTDIDPTDEAEVQSQIHTLKPKKAPGMDNITNTAVKFLPPSIVKCFTIIINEILLSKIFPRKWKQARVIFILKHGKPRSDAGSYRPISLLPALGKLVERIILSRLKEQCEALNIIPPHQFGFRENHSTELQLLRMTEELHNSFDSKDTSVGVFLDIQRAFDTVWHEGLVAKLFKYNINPSLIRLIQSYITERSFVVSVDQATSAPRAIRAGLAQGSVLSPFLYNLYTADFPSTEGVSLYTYADDTALISTSRNERFAHKRMQTALDKACIFFKTWKLVPHPDKSQHAVFTARLNLPPRPLTINGRPIPRSKVIKYLGVHFDSTLTWRHHILATAKKCSQALGILYPLMSRDSYLSLPNKLLLFKQSFRPIMSYASLVWGSSASCNIKKLQIMQNKFLRMACNAPRSINLIFLHEELGIDQFITYITNANIKKLEKAAIHENPLVSQSQIYEPTRRSFRNRPKTFLLPPPDP